MKKLVVLMVCIIVALALCIDLTFVILSFYRPEVDTEIAKHMMWWMDSNFH